MSGLRYVTLLATVLALPAWAWAGCPSDAQVAEVTKAYFAKVAAPSYGKGMPISDAYCAQRKYVHQLEEKLGARAGYKVAFTSEAAQKSFGITEPVCAVLFRSTFLRAGSELPAKFGNRPLFEADLIVKVKDEGIMRATTHLEAARHLEEVIPFIELVDIMVAKGEPLDGGVATAMNAMTRGGVVGPGMKVQPTPEFVAAMSSMEAVVTNDQGEELVRAKGSSLLGHPLNVVLWLTSDLKKQGQTLRAGDYISLGSLGKLLPPQPGRTYTIRYSGLPGGTPETSIRFK